MKYICLTNSYFNSIWIDKHPIKAQGIGFEFMSGDGKKAKSVGIKTQINCSKIAFVIAHLLISSALL